MTRVRPWPPLVRDAYRNKAEVRHFLNDLRQVVGHDGVARVHPAWGRRPYCGCGGTRNVQHSYGTLVLGPRDASPWCTARRTWRHLSHPGHGRIACDLVASAEARLPAQAQDTAITVSSPPSPYSVPRHRHTLFPSCSTPLLACLTAPAPPPHALRAHRMRCPRQLPRGL